MSTPGIPPKSHPSANATLSAGPFRGRVTESIGSGIGSHNSIIHDSARSAAITPLPETTAGPPEATTGQPETIAGQPETIAGQPETTPGQAEMTAGQPETIAGQPEATAHLKTSGTAVSAVIIRTGGTPMPPTLLPPQLRF